MKCKEVRVLNGFHPQLFQQKCLFKNFVSSNETHCLEVNGKCDDELEIVCNFSDNSDNLEADKILDAVEDGSSESNETLADDSEP